MEKALNRKIKIALYYSTRANRPGVYGCFDVAFKNNTVDYLFMTSDNRFHCYHIRASEEDLYDFIPDYGDYNYLVVPAALGERTEGYLKNIKRSDVGILTFHEETGVFGEDIRFRIHHNAKQRLLSLEQRIRNMDTMIRSQSRFMTQLVRELQKKSDLADELWEI